MYQFLPPIGRKLRHVGTICGFWINGCGVGPAEARFRFAISPIGSAIARKQSKEENQTGDHCSGMNHQGEAKVFKKYPQMKSQMKREGVAKMNRKANETGNLCDDRGLPVHCVVRPCAIAVLI